MDLIRFRHRGLERLYEGKNAKGIPSGMLDKLRKLLFALETAGSLQQLKRFPGWNLHPLKGEFEGFRESFELLSRHLTHAMKNLEETRGKLERFHWKLGQVESGEESGAPPPPDPSSPGE